VLFENNGGHKVAEKDILDDKLFFTANPNPVVNPPCIPSEKVLQLIGE
jgi:3-hydroxymyristoyl/3-hydroxydecanoyl-(acyl carrier protein) dehydratase